MAKAALGFRVRSGWAAAVVLANAAPPKVLHVRRIELSDPGFPESRQPYHAVDDAICELERDESLIEKRVEVVRVGTTKSTARLLADCRQQGWQPDRAGLVGGSLGDPLVIRSPHIRAHALEGRLFRTTLEEALRAQGLPCLVLGEKTAFKTASEVIHSPEAALKRAVAGLRPGGTGPWRADEKLAALAAWVAIAKG